MSLKRSVDYEQNRLGALRQLNLLDTPPSESFDRITRMASRLFEVPIAAVSLTDNDRQWFKSRVGVEHWEIPRFKACCGEVADTSKTLLIPDLQASPFYRDSFLASSGIRFYAGAPLLTRDGYTLGAMCILDKVPREVTAQQIDMLEDLAAMVMAQIELQHAYGRVDPLTGLPNRSQLGEDLLDLARDRADQSAFAVFTELVDVAGMLSLQRVMGPSYLDELSRAASQGLSASMAPGSYLYHVGQCQFVHLLTDTSEPEAILQATWLREVMLSLTPREAAAVMVRPAIGIAPFILGKDSVADVLRMAHSACHDARSTESGAGLYSRERDNRMQRQFRLLADFHAALEQPGQLHLHYQPRVDLATGRCIGAEALIRWNHPELGAIPPAEFIPVVEQTRYARPLTRWVLQTAIRQAADWHAQKLDLRISVNVSGANLQEDDFAALLLDGMGDAVLPGSAIELELTESALVGKGATAARQLAAISAAGIEIAIDDFGTGYSSLAYLQSIPAQVVKIDRSFVARIDREWRSLRLVKSMINMAQELGYRVVAEGVETSESLETLCGLGCNEAQGYLLSRPLSPEDFEHWLDERNRLPPEPPDADSIEA